MRSFLVVMLLGCPAAVVVIVTVAVIVLCRRRNAAPARVTVRSTRRVAPAGTCSFPRAIRMDLAFGCFLALAFAANAWPGRMGWAAVALALVTTAQVGPPQPTLPTEIGWPGL